MNNYPIDLNINKNGERLCRQVRSLFVIMEGRQTIEICGLKEYNYCVCNIEMNRAIQGRYDGRYMDE